MLYWGDLMGAVPMEKLERLSPDEIMEYQGQEIERLERENADLRAELEMTKKRYPITFGNIEIPPSDFDSLSKLKAGEESDIAALARIVLAILHDIEEKDSYELEQKERSD